jgi:hypothetical protein
MHEHVQQEPGGNPDHQEIAAQDAQADPHGATL